MGAANAMRAYINWAPTLPPLSMQVLVYMALVAKDDDPEPWFGQGDEALAIHALGRPEPIDDSDLKAVRRVTMSLKRAKAIETVRRPAPRGDGYKTARYRLHLGLAPTEAVDEGSDVGRNASGDRRTKSGRNVGRNSVRRRTKFGESPDGNRPTEEYEENEEVKEEDNHAPARPSERAREPVENQQQQLDTIFGAVPGGRVDEKPSDESKQPSAPTAEADQQTRSLSRGRTRQ